ncbi:NeuD/PglB/VioB family sugar acetyltransferase [Klenkia brasiliensis]|uniref:Sugar O-acyltransferase, sialic acid O-acetyltransferase NeuD family n=1 Tax=Klenkia brasiliensis TaxID=333142 RepID=A0A1G7LGX8_9ACTN|nr:NeuD/PglB/VioB family sugar acetyltransferase [Klenkia brasiliensis]SDF48681.1 sugar O-acyltransferase, sialic acid O-acetyltransferase NeuD family [Klenkia brasiliensis]
MTTTRLAIIGAGGFGREVHDVVEAIEDSGRPDRLVVVGFLADGDGDVSLVEERGVPFLGPVAELEGLPDDVGYVVAIGSGAARRAIDTWASGLGRPAVTLVHPAASVGRHRVELGPGTVVLSGATITTNVRTGRSAQVHAGVVVGHDATIGDYATLCPNVSVTGNVTVGDGAFLGSGCSVVPGVTIGANAVVGAGAAVVSDIPADALALGVPARVRPPR